MKTQSLIIAIVSMLFMCTSSYAGTIDDGLKFFVDVFKGQINESLKDTNYLGPHISKTEKDPDNEKLQICKFWLDQYSRSETERNETKTIDSCTAAGIDMSKYQK